MHEDLEATYTLFNVHRNAHWSGKPVVDFPLVVIIHFSACIMVEALRANIDRESPFLKGVGGAIYPTISGIEDDVSHPVNAFQRCL